VSRGVYVLDTSAVIAGFVPGIIDVRQVTVQNVLDEAKDLCSKLELETAVAAGKISVMEPSKETLVEVRKKMGQTGDRVSDTDVKLLALSLDILRGGDTPELVTDDYAIQNLARTLNIPFKKMMMPGITKIFTWRMVCPACKRKYPTNVSNCDFCGSELVRRPKSSSE
jgi:UPF0271 protein